MKKFLLLAAALVAVGASAQTLTQDWKTTANTALTTNDCRQGVGINGKIYINCKSDSSVYVVDQSGLVKTDLQGGGNCGINTDEAGNLVISNAVFPNSWGGTSSLLVVNPTTKAVKTIALPADPVTFGRSDFLGKANGDLAGDGGFLMAVGGASTGVSMLAIADGECSEDDSYVMTTGEATFGGASTSGICNLFKYAGSDTYNIICINRSGAPVIYENDGDNLKVKTSLNIKDRGACNGGTVFAVGGKTYYAHPLTPNYQDGWAVECLEETMTVDESTYVNQVARVETSVSANPNGIQANWLNAEVVDANTAKIYQYVPNGYCAQYTFTVQPTGVNDINVAKANSVKKVVENGQVVIYNGNAKYNVMGAQLK